MYVGIVGRVKIKFDGEADGLLRQRLATLETRQGVGQKLIVDIRIGVGTFGSIVPAIVNPKLRYV